MTICPRLNFKLCVCGDIKRGDEAKKHFRAHKGSDVAHYATAKVSACIACLAFAEYGNEEFYKEHSHCPALKITNARFQKRVKEQLHNIRTAQVDLDDDDSKSSESARAVGNIQQYLTPRTVADVEEDLYLSESEDERPQSSTEGVKAAEKAAEPAAAAEKAAEPANVEEEEAAESDEGELVVVQGDAPMPIGSSSPRAPSPRPPKGIGKQNAEWTDNIIATHESQRLHYNRLKEREECLSNSNKRLQGENDALKSKLARISNLRARINELEKFESRYNRVNVEKKALEKEVEKVKNEKGNLAEENASLRTKIKEMEAANVIETRRTTIHVPVYRNKIVDECILAKEDLDSTTECYGVRPDFSCLHLSLIHGGPIYKLHHHRTTFRTPSKYIIPTDCNFIILIPSHLFSEIFMPPPSAPGSFTPAPEFSRYRPPATAEPSAEPSAKRHCP